MQTYQLFQDEFERKLETFLDAEGYTGEHLVTVVARKCGMQLGGGVENEPQTATISTGSDVVGVILASLEYDVFIEMIRIAQKRAKRP